ncbi:hypothetical protein [Streptomyces sp. NPDC056160]|uniref:hypothetical protein n=1 Tax=Streptomyces sp. NPDC056160 TaxID=3345731 RepID=UPI0035D70393
MERMNGDGAAADLARVVLTAMPGGVVMLQTTGRTDYLRAALAAALEPLRAPAAARG